MGISGPRSARGAVVIGTVLASLWTSAAFAVNVNLVSGAVGADIEVYKELVKPWEEKTGNTVTFVPMPSSTTDQFAQYKLWLAAGNADIDVYLVDVIWAPQLSDQFVDRVDVDVLVPGREPKFVLGELVGSRGGHRDEGDRVAGLLLPGLHQLLVDLDVCADGAGDEVDVDGERGRRPERREHGAEDKSAAHSARSRNAHPILPNV